MDQSLTSKIENANSALFIDGNLDAVDQFFTTDYVAHLTDEDMTGGHKAIRKVLDVYHRAFVDFKVKIDILVSANDRVAWQRTVHAVHKNAFKGFPPTGLPIVWRDMVTSRFCDGLIAEEWVISDLAERFLLARKQAQKAG